ncbi:hypothetical protein EUGRSUZ_C02097 [Eucalyptus grandis]|uniref:Uncharacterized protein n=2 Tax=Eucalyptus grandis TaxID=71139 RepID=A0ACC3LFV1_EUCGR|nr:hypothetical protein EUGRSUZ_C02097 [Eucalyptus grandis]
MRKNVPARLVSHAPGKYGELASCGIPSITQTARLWIVTEPGNHGTIDKPLLGQVPAPSEWTWSDKSDDRAVEVRGNL